MCSLDRRSTDRISEEIAGLAAQLDAGTCRFLGLVAEFDRRSGWADAGASSCAAWLSWRCAISPTTAREQVRVAGALARLPRTAALFARGRLSYSKVRAITRLENVEHEQALLAIAVDATAAQLERAVRDHRTVARLNDEATATREQRFLRLDYQENGSVRLRGRLSAEEAAVLQTALDHTREQLQAGQADAPPDDGPLEQRAASDADALLAMADAALTAPVLEGRSAPERHQVVVRVDLDALDARTPAAGHLADGEALAPSVVRRLCCDSSYVALFEREGSTIDVGRRTRSISPALRRALQARDRGCRFPGCQRTRHLDAHHVEHWLNGGATSPENLLLLCGRHHAALHEGNFTLRLTADGQPTFQGPDGRLLPAHPQAPCIEGRTRLRRQHITAHTTAPGSNGPYDPGLVTDAMLNIAPLLPPSTNAPG